MKFFIKMVESYLAIRNEKHNMTNLHLNFHNFYSWFLSSRTFESKIALFSYRLLHVDIAALVIKNILKTIIPVKMVYPKKAHTQKVLFAYFSHIHCFTQTNKPLINNRLHRFDWLKIK